MDAQDFRSLQEAYLEVVENQQLDEGKIPLDRVRRSKIGRQIGKRVHSASSEISASGSGFMPKGIRDKLRQSAAKKVGEIQTMMGALKSAQKNESYDYYDIILSHLLDEGYAETPEAAEVMMVNMSEEWRESIVEAKKPLPISKMKNKEDKLLNNDDEQLSALRSPVGSPQRKKRMRDLQRFDNINSVRTSFAKRGGKEPHPMPEVGRYKPKNED